MEIRDIMDVDIREGGGGGLKGSVAGCLFCVFILGGRFRKTARRVEFGFNLWIKTIDECIKKSLESSESNVKVYDDMVFVWLNEGVDTIDGCE